MVESAWDKTPGELIDPDKLPQVVKDALESGQSGPLVSRGSFAQYAEDDDRA